MGRRAWALITDGQSRAAVAGVRALGIARISVCVLAPSRPSPALWSRYAASRRLGPPSLDEQAFVARIAEVVTLQGPSVVLPGQEQAVGALARHAHQLPEEAILPFPGPEPALALSDKSAVAELSAAAGLASPRTLAAGPAGELAAERLPAPCVVKAFGLSPALPDVRVCETRMELDAVLGDLPSEEPVIVQERAAGALIALSIVLDRDGSVAALFQSRATRLWPGAAGASSLSVSVEPDPDLVDRAVALLRDVGWWGLAHMQFLETARGPALIDVNVRFYGSLPLATAAGVNLPATWHRVALGGRPEPPAPYRLGVRYRWLEGELLAALKGEPGRLTTRPVRGGAGAMWSPDDPLPGFLLALHVARTYAAGGFRRLAGYGGIAARRSASERS